MLRTNVLGLTTRARPSLLNTVRSISSSTTFRSSASKPQFQEKIRSKAPATTEKVGSPASNVLPSAMPSSSLFGGPKVEPSLAPYTGRTLNVFHNVNATYRRLGSILAQNNVRRELKANEYYEKPNVARRRQKIQQNKKLFGALVRKKVALIMQMKQRGM
ncbi:hypothetical protein VKS41_001210 [Umbelopsis sp. WA50703]